MVGQLIRLKLRIMWNVMCKQVVVLILSLIALLYGLGLVGALYVGVGALSESIPPEFIMLIGPLVFLGWLILPLLFSTIDNTLEPRRLSPFIAPSPKLAFALVAASALGIGGIFSLLLFLLPAWFFLTRGELLLSLGATCAAILSLLTAVIWAKSVTTWAGNQVLKNSERKNFASFVGSMIFVAVFAPMGIWMQFLIRNFSYDAVLAFASKVYTTPFGAFFGVLESLRQGDYLLAGIRCAIGLVTLTLGWVLWIRVLKPSMYGSANRVSAKAREAIEAGRYHVDEARAEAELTKQRSDSRSAGLKRVQRWQALGLSGRSAAMATKTAYYWLHDSRLSVSLGSTILFPAMAVLMDYMIDSDVREFMPFSFGFFLYFAPIVIGANIGANMQYDSTGAWVPIAAGMTGREDRLGRLLGSLAIVAPVILVASGAACVIMGKSVLDIVYTLCLCILFLTASSGIATVVGSRWVYPVQQPGASPLSTRGAGAGMVAMWATSAAMLGGLLVALPGWLALIFTTGTGIPFIIAVVASLAWSVAIIAVSVVWGGRLWDRYKVEMLTTMKSWAGN